jgi:hypothetical protein
VYGEQLYHMRSCKKQSERLKSLSIAVGWAWLQEAISWIFKISINILALFQYKARSFKTF